MLNGNRLDLLPTGELVGEIGVEDFDKSSPSWRARIEAATGDHGLRISPANTPQYQPQGRAFPVQSCSNSSDGQSVGVAIVRGNARPSKLSLQH